MHMPVTLQAGGLASSRYRTRRVNPVALFLAGSMLLGMAALVSTLRLAVEPAPKSAPLVVHALDLTPPPSPPDPVSEPPPQAQPVLHVPKPVITPPVSPQQPQLLTTPEIPPERPPSPQPATASNSPAPAASPAPLPPTRTISAGNLSSSMTHAPPPRYPRESRRSREQGTVVLRVVLEIDGSVAEIAISRSSGHSRLDEAARNAVRKWRWSPTIRDGVAARVTGTVSIPFVLTG